MANTLSNLFTIWLAYYGSRNAEYEKLPLRYTIGNAVRAFKTFLMLSVIDNCVVAYRESPWSVWEALLSTQRYCTMPNSPMNYL